MAESFPSRRRSLHSGHPDAIIFGKRMGASEWKKQPGSLFVCPHSLAINHRGDKLVLPAVGPSVA